MSNIDRSELQQAAAAERDAATQAQSDAIFKVMAYHVGPRAARAILERAATGGQGTLPEAPPSRVAALAAALGG